MNTLPIFALGLVAGGYTYATSHIEDYLSGRPTPRIIAYDAEGTDSFAADDFANCVSQTPTDLTGSRCYPQNVLAMLIETDLEETFVDTSFQGDGLVIDH